MKKFWIKKGLMILFFGIAAILIFGFVVMGLWNAILPVVLGVKVITFWQALGILLLSILPPLILLLGANLNQLANCFADSNLLIPCPTSLISVSTVE